MGAARRGVKISCDQRGNIEGTEWNLIFSTLHCTPRRVAIDRNMSTAVLYLGLMSQYDLMFDLKIKVGHCDLYFMVQ